MPDFNWPEAPPLDVAVLAREMEALWLDSWRKAERDACREAGVELLFHVSYHQAARLRERVIELLIGFDANRGQHLKFLKDELIRIHNTMMQPIFIPRDPAKGPVTSKLLPCTTTVKEWGGGEIPSARVRCITCGTEYAVDPSYDVCLPCPFCRSTVVKAVLTDPTKG